MKLAAPLFSALVLAFAATFASACVVASPDETGDPEDESGEFVSVDEEALEATPETPSPAQGRTCACSCRVNQTHVVGDPDGQGCQVVCHNYFYAHPELCDKCCGGGYPIGK